MKRPATRYKRQTVSGGGLFCAQTLSIESNGMNLNFQTVTYDCVLPTGISRLDILVRSGYFDIFRIPHQAPVSFRYREMICTTMLHMVQ